MQVKVLVVDDSLLMRVVISRLLARTPGILVVGTAVNGLDALEKIKSLRPDVVTLDVEMPLLNGLDALRRIMRESRVPVVMLSTHTTAGARDSMEALALGAVDFVPKPSRQEDLPRMALELAEKIRVAAGARLRGEESAAVPPAPSLAVDHTKEKIELVVIGASTGGPVALQAVISALPPDFGAAAVVVQHLPEGFSRSLAEHLGRKAKVPVRHAEQNDHVARGQVLVAPAGADLIFKGSPGGAYVTLIRSEKPHPPGVFRPSVDGVMTSAAQIFGSRVLGVLLTGMGKDGALGMKQIREAGGHTIAQDKGSCVVYGMPRSAIESGVVDRVLPLSQIPGGILSLL